MKRISLIMMMAATVSFTACIKDNAVNLGPGASPPVVEWETAILQDAPTNAATNIYRTYARSFEISAAVKQDFKVGLTGTDPASSDVTVGVGVKAQAVADYNTKYSTTYTVLPANMYTMPASVVIPKGSRTAAVSVTINATLFDLTKTYVLPLTITSTTAGNVSGNYGTVFYILSAKNKYDGVYSAKGLFVRAGDGALGGYFKNLNYSLITQGPNSITFAQTFATGAGVAGIDGTTITVDPVTNLVTMSASGNPLLANYAPGLIWDKVNFVGLPGTGFVNRYDPATKTFYLCFSWGSGGAPPSSAPNGRAAQDTLTFSKSR